MRTWCGGFLRKRKKLRKPFFFVNKKKQKNFDLLKPLALTVTNPAGIKSFLLLFFKKEVLSSASKQPLARSALAFLKNL
jgi:hypothetical protein